MSAADYARSFARSFRDARAPSYVWESRWYVAAALVLFVVAVGCSAFFYDQRPDVREPDYREAREQVLAGKSDNHVILAAQILLNNVVAAGLAMASGVAWGVGPVWGILSNARVIGLVYAELVAARGVASGTAYLLVGILPHGCVELLAFFVCTGTGLRLGVMAVEDTIEDLRAYATRKPKEERKQLGRAHDERFLHHAGSAARVFALIVLPLLVAAAIIEGFITPIFLGML